MSLSTNIIAKIIATDTSFLDVASNITSFGDRDPINLANGTGANQADKLWSDTRTLAPSASEELDLNLLTNPGTLGVVNFAKIKAILIVTPTGNGANIEIGNAAATQFLGGFGGAVHRWAIPPGGVFLVAAPKDGWPATDGVSDKLKINNTGGAQSNDYTIYLIGCSS